MLVEAISGFGGGCGGCGGCCCLGVGLYWCGAIGGGSYCVAVLESRRRFCRWTKQNLGSSCRLPAVVVMDVPMWWW